MKTFDELSKHLNQLMVARFVAVDQQKNPIVQSLSRAKTSQLVYVIRQYSIFPRELVSFIKAAQQSALEAGWLEIAEELQENIEQELGSSTQGVSHYDLLAEGLEEALNLPIKATKPSIATSDLLERMQDLYNQDAVYILGAMYAIEATSISELTILTRIIRQLIGKEMPHNLRYFFDMHLNEWEPEHEEELRRTLARHINIQDFQQFEAGFCAVMKAMDLWWTELALEASSQARMMEFVAA
jgi:Domain of Unknown Function with PDB structure (DUF3865)